MNNFNELGWRQRAEQRLQDTSRRDTEAKTKQIVLAALDQISEHGLAGFTVKTVLARCGIALTTFYSRFQGKDDLMIAVFEESVSQSADELAESLTRLGTDDPKERLKFIALQLINHSWHADISPLINALTQEYRRLADALPEQLEYAMLPIHRLMAREIEHGQAQGIIRAADPINMAILIRCAITASYLRVPAGLGPAEAKAYADNAALEVWDFCWRGIRK